MSTPIHTRYSPSFALIQAHFALGVAGLLVFAGALLLRAVEVQGFFFQPLLLGLVHLCVLGWLLPIAIGALHQLVPVVFEVPVRSERLAWIAFGLYAVAAPLFISRMWVMDVGLLLPVAATAAAAAIWMYGGNLLATLVGSRHRTLSGACVIAALGYLLVAVTGGALLAWNLHEAYLPIFHIAILRAHAHAAGLGFFALLVMGVAYRLLEMFLLSHGAPERAGWIGFFATNLAVLALVASFLRLSEPWLLGVGVAAATVGIGAFLVQARAIYVRRVRKQTDVSLHHTATSFFYLGAAVLVGGALALLPVGQPLWDRLHLGYGLLVLPGFLGTIIVGQLYKIVPFLVFLNRFSTVVGLKKLKPASALLSERSKRAQYLLMHAGIFALLAGVLLDAAPLRVAGATSFALSAALFARNLGVILASRP